MGAPCYVTVCNVPNQPKHATQASPDRHCSPVSGLITLYLYPPETECVGPDKRRLIWIDTLRRGHNVGFLVERLIVNR